MTRCGDLECADCWGQIHHQCSPMDELVCSTCGAEWVELPMSESAVFRNASPGLREALSLVAVAYERTKPGLASV